MNMLKWTVCFSLVFVLIFSSLVCSKQPLVQKEPVVSQKNTGEKGAWFPYPVKNKWGFIDLHGNKVIEAKYDFLYEQPWIGRYVVVGLGDRENMRFGMIDRQGQWVIKPVYEGLLPVSTEGIIVAQKSQGKYGLLDEKGKWLCKPIYTYLLEPDQGLCAVKKKGKWGYVDYHGKIVIEPKYATAYGFRSGIAMVVSESDHCGFIDKTGKTVIPLIYKSAYSGVVNGMVILKDSHGYFYANMNGEPLFGKHFQDARHFNEDLASVKINGKWGFIDATGQVAIMCQYDRVSKFSTGLAPVKLKRRWFYIDTHGKKTFSKGYDKAGSFKEGLALVRIGNSWRYINTNGEIVAKGDLADWMGWTE